MIYCQVRYSKHLKHLLLLRLSKLRKRSLRLRTLQRTKRKERKWKLFSRYCTKGSLLKKKNDLDSIARQKSISLHRKLRKWKPSLRILMSKWKRSCKERYLKRGKVTSDLIVQLTSTTVKSFWRGHTSSFSLKSRICTSKSQKRVVTILKEWFFHFIMSR